MPTDPWLHCSPRATGAALRAYLLETIEFDAAHRLQKVLAFEASEERDAGALVLCEHPPLITVGRQGSSADVRCGPEELRARRWRVRWVNRGGGTWLHGPGQLAVYAILPLEQWGMGVDEYLRRLQRVVIGALNDFSVPAEPTWEGVLVGGRLLAPVGVAVRNWVAYFGAVVNLHTDLSLQRLVRGRPGDAPITSLGRERRGALRPALFRERLLEHFRDAFVFQRTALFSHHPVLDQPRPVRTAAARHGST
jgi:lipoyl(octanoyl) transferase